MILRVTQVNVPWRTVVICLCALTVQHLWLRNIPCRESAGRRQNETRTAKPRTLYIITPTYRRPQQLAELTRLAQTLMHVPHLVWLVIEDANSKTEEVARLLDRTGMRYVHLTAPMPEKYKSKTNSIGSLPRGVSNRNRGLEWLRANATSGVFYFADDDNTYDIRLFEEMRSTVRVSMWPVGLISAGFSAPLVRGGKLYEFYEGWIGNRVFPVDMAEFAVSVEFLLLRPNARMPYSLGYEEDGFLKSLSPFHPIEVEVKASNCTEYRY